MSRSRLLRHVWCSALMLLDALGACSSARPTPSSQPASPAPSSEPATPAPSEAPAAVVADPYHPPPRDTVDVVEYRAWQQYSLQCARCHGEDGQGTSFGPSLLAALKPDGNVPSREEFLDILTKGREDKGMPPAAKLGVDSVYFDGLYQYLKGRSDGRLHGGRPARREN